MDLQNVLLIAVFVLFFVALIAMIIGVSLRDRKRERLFLVISIISLFLAFGGAIYVRFIF